MTVMTETEILRSIVPKARVDSVTFENSDEGKKLLVTVRYSIYDVVESNSISQWFANQDYEKYFMIQERLNVRFDQDKINLYQFVENRNTKELSDDVTLEVESPDGSDVRKFNFTTRFTVNIENKSIANMTLQLITKFDIDAMEYDLDIDLFSIFDSRNTSYSDFDGDGEMDLLANYENVAIIRQGSLVYPIMDFRVRDFMSAAARSVMVSGQSIISEFYDRYRDSMVKMEREKEVMSQYLSDLWISRSSRGVPRFMFIYDPTSYFRHNSPYRGFFNNMTEVEKAAVIKNMEVPSLRILRKRVLKHKGPDGVRIVKYADSDTETVLVETSKRRGQRAFHQAVTEKGRIRQVKISVAGLTIPEEFSSILGNVNVATQDRQMEYFSRKFYFLTGDDLEVANLGDGQYVYGVSIEIADNIRDYLISKVLQMLGFVNELEIIYNELYNSEDYDAQNNAYIGSSPEDILGQDIYQRLTKIVEGFSSSLKVFINKDISLPQNFVSLFSQASEVKFDINCIRTLSDIIRNTISSALVGLGESETSILREGEVFAANNSIPTSAKGIIRDRVKSIKYYDSVEKVFDSTKEKRTYLDYLSNFSEHMDVEVLQEINSLTEDTGEIGLRVIDGASYSNRIETELSRVFTSTTGTITQLPSQSESVTRNLGNIQESVSITGQGSEYILPASIVEEGIRTSSLVGAIADAMMNNTLDFSVHQHTPPHGQTKEETILSTHNVTFSHSLRQRNKNTLLDTDTGILKFTDIVAPDERNEDNDPLEIPDHIYEREDQFERYLYNKVRKVIPLPDNNQERLFSNSSFPQRNYSMTPITEEEFRVMPNLLRAVTNPLNSLVRAGADLLQGEAVVYSQLLMMIEYLEGFSDNDSRLSPVWKGLTLEEYRRNTNKSLLCRIKPSHYSSLGIRTSTSGVPVYDSYFIVRPVGQFNIATPLITVDVERLTLAGTMQTASMAMLAHYDELIAERTSELRRMLIAAMDYMREYGNYGILLERYTSAPLENYNAEELSTIREYQRQRDSARQIVFNNLSSANYFKNEIVRLRQEREAFELRSENTSV